MKETIKMNALAGIAILGLLLCGAEATTMESQVLISLFGLCLFMGSTWKITTLVRKKENKK